MSASTYHFSIASGVGLFTSIPQRRIGLVIRRQPDHFGLTVVLGMGLLQVDAERRPARNRGVEEVYRKIRAQSAVDEPALLREKRPREGPRLGEVAVIASRQVDVVERKGRKQQRNAEAEPRRDDDRKVLGVGKRAKENALLADGRRRAGLGMSLAS